MHNEHDPLADCGRDAVRCYAQVRPHMQAVDPGDVENRSFHTQCCHGKTTRTLEVMFGRDTFLGRVPKCFFFVPEKFVPICPFTYLLKFYFTRMTKLIFPIFQLSYYTNSY